MQHTPRSNKKRISPRESNVVVLNTPIGTRPVQAAHKAARGSHLVPEQCWVVEESVLNIDVDQLGGYSLMWTPTHDTPAPYGYTAEDGLLGSDQLPESLAITAGFLLSEGIIGSLNDLRCMSVCADTPDVVQVQLGDAAKPKPRRKDVVINSSCGICGGRDELEQSLQQLPKVGQSLQCHGDSFIKLMNDMQQRQTVFARTGGAHCAAIFSASGDILAQAEDLGRHNALDKVIGECLLQGIDLHGCGVLLSSRLSLEMVSKAARAGLEIMAAVSAPTSLAIEIAERCNITLCGFVRGERLTVYSHVQRIGDGLSTEQQQSKI